jgi:hypothetical protein
MLTITVDGGEPRTISAAQYQREVDSGFGKFPCREQRLFEDWTLSSAGRSGARLSDHWALDIFDRAHEGGRHVGFVPLWAFARKLAEVGRAPDIRTLYGKLQTIDRRTGVPFGWYFFMLHGNRVHDGAGRAILRAAEAGQLVLPEHDYQVLKRWHQRPYGF